LVKEVPEGGTSVYISKGDEGVTSVEGRCLHGISYTKSAGE